MKIGIVGMGLIGGSIYKDLKALGYDVTEGAAQDCDLVFVCTPMNKTLAVLDELETVVKPETIVADVCSLKEFVCQKPRRQVQPESACDSEASRAAQFRQRPYRFVPTHPMAGDTKPGFENSREGMFQGAKWVVCSECPPELREIIEKLGATAVFMDADEHDRAAAMVSHMPMVIAKALLLAADDRAKSIAGRGFADMTRLAATHNEMASDMIHMNAENIRTALLQLYSAIDDVISDG